MPNCDDVRAGLVKKKPKPYIPNTYLLLGPGSALKYIFMTRYKTSSCAGCHTAAIQMDKDGPDKVSADVTKYAEMIHENAKSQTWTAVLDFFDYAMFGLSHYESLVREAVELHLQEKAKRANPPQVG